MEREARTSVRAHQGKREEAGALDGAREADRGRDGQQGARPEGEAKSASPSSTRDISSGRRGGLRSGSGPGGRTKDQLYNEAKRRGIKGRSRMNKAQLQRAVAGKSSRSR